MSTSARKLGIKSLLVLLSLFFLAAKATCFRRIYAPCKRWKLQMRNLVLAAKRHARDRAQESRRRIPLWIQTEYDLQRGRVYLYSSWKPSPVSRALVIPIVMWLQVTRWMDGIRWEVKVAVFIESGHVIGGRPEELPIDQYRKWRELTDETMGMRSRAMGGL